VVRAGVRPKPRCRAGLWRPARFRGTPQFETGAQLTRPLFLLFNHQFTPDQEADARASLGVERVVKLPKDLQEIWSEIPPELEAISPRLDPIRRWLELQADPGDYVLIQGDFGATFLMIQFALEKNLIPIYSTSHRKAVETRQPDGSIVLTHHFRHTRFRHYGR